MGFALDHIVIAVTDLDVAIADYKSLGFTVFPGGVHHGGVSHNALVVFADGSYFEIIAYQKTAPENVWWKLLTEQGEGLVDFALSPDDTHKDLTAARARGLDLDGPTAGGRLRPDGVRLDWEIVRPKGRDLPFWCGDVTPRALRVPEGDHRRHENGVQGIALVQVTVADLAFSVDRYKALVGPDAVTQVADRIHVTIGSSVIELVAAVSEAAISRLKLRGEGASSVVLVGGQALEFPSARLHGVDLRVQGR